MSNFTFGSLFAGIGGLDLGLERAGMICRWQAEIDPFRQQILQRHWPHVPKFGDVKDVGKHNLLPVDLIAGGFPCQPHSVAGKRRGKADNRNLWPEFLRIVRELRPSWVLAENVPGIISLYLDTVLADLESEGYTCWTFNIPACAFDAPHRRERIFVVAHTNSRRQQRESVPIRQGRSHKTTAVTGRGCEDVAYADSARLERPARARQSEQRREKVQSPSGSKDVPNPNGKGLQGQRVSRTTRDGDHWAVEPDVGRVAHGVSRRVDRLRLEALGNAVVPQVSQWLGQQILKAAALGPKSRKFPAEAKPGLQGPPA